MTGHAHPLAARHQITVALDIEGAVGIQAAEHHSVNAQFTAHSDISRHALHFQVAVEEVAATGTDNHMQASRREHTASHLDFTVTGRRSALGDAGTQFHAVGPTFLCSQAGLHTVGTHFYHKLLTFHRYLNLSCQLNVPLMTDHK